jgi:two-component system, NtrC family, sensor histidine kinase PilS
MSPGRPHTIYPCPFSKNYGIPVEQAWLLLKVFFLYRFIISTLFVILYFSYFVPTVLGTHDIQLYFLTSSTYLATTLLGFPFIFKRLLSYVSQAQLFIFSDIIFITLLMHSCGGVGSGIGILLVITTAAGGMLVGGRCAMVFAALASIAILAEQLYSMRSHDVTSSALTYSGMLGASYFTIAFLAYIMAKRTEQSDLLAHERQETIARLEELNRYIIQHLQNGIIICNQQLQIQLSNEATQTLLNLTSPPVNLKDVNPQLADAINRWQQDSSQDFAILQLTNDQEIQARFTRLKTDREALFMIIFEDIALYNQRLQQNKLASLGRLTASIAHEIRNPLGAISHAGQLLSEAPELTVQDKRLTEIIQNHSQRVNNIIEDILKLSRRAPSKKEKLALDQWLPDFVSNMIAAQGWKENQFRLQLADHGLNALMDSGHLKQILHNLCSNALKYGCKQSEVITIKLAYDNRQPCISVIDNGPGVTKDVRQHLFEPFFTTSANGTGLGLYISRELAELNQAKLSYDYRNNTSCFTLCLQNADEAVISL